MRKKILVTGGDGRFAKVLKKNNKLLNIIFKSKNDCNILDLITIASVSDFSRLIDRKEKKYIRRNPLNLKNIYEN